MSKLIRAATIALEMSAAIVVGITVREIEEKYLGNSDTDGIHASSGRATYMLYKESDTWVRLDGIDIKRVRYGGKCYAVGTGKVYDVGYATIDGKPVRILER